MSQKSEYHIWLLYKLIKELFFPLGMYRVPPGQTVQVEAADASKMKIGVVYHIPTDFEIVS